jgi:peptide/nickel transport system substrate-binding protein
MAACARQQAGSRVLRMAYPYQIVTLDPHAHANTVTRGVLSAVYEGLVEFERGFPIRPRLSDRWSTPDDTTWRLHVRPGVLFHDGSELSADDVVASIDRARTSILGGVHLQDVASVHVDPDDPRMVEISTNRPSPMLLTRLEAVAIVPRDFDPMVPVGTGPYRWQLGSREGPIALERWASYWDIPPDFAEVVIDFVPAAHALETVAGSGGFDVVTSVDVATVRGRALPHGWQMVASPAVTTAFLGLNVGRAPLDQPEVRRAIDLAIDRDDLVSDVFPEGAARTAWSLVPHDILGFSPDLRRSGPDVVAARTVLEGAGASDAGSLELAHPRERFSEVAAHVVGQLGSSGLQVQPAAFGFDEFHDRLNRGADFDLFLFNWTFRVADASRFFDLLVRGRDPVKGFGSYNATSFSQPKLDRMIEDAIHQPRIAVREEGLQRVLLAVDAARIYLPLYRLSALSVVRDDLVVGDFSCPAIRAQDVRILRD